MAIFAVVLKQPNQNVRERLAAEYPDHYQLSDTFSLVESGELAETIAIKAGIKGESQAPDVSGVVFRLGRAYSGYTTRSLWEWLGARQDNT